ncbi:MAG TPA: ACP S-malonyltransferase [Acidimicrobiales bacterium]|nr:ACP S-malonyltransferase [Acidimicrobiales bacterium]
MVAFTFPGQGSQRPGMGAPWAEHESWELVEEASAIAGRDVADLLLNADAAELQNTRSSQLATFVLSLVVLDAVERLGVAPSAAAGHSLGEYTALTATGALSFPDGVRIVAARGEAMQVAAEDNPGTMSAILGLDDDDCDAACRRADGDVWVANFNAPGQVVIAGSHDGVSAAGAIAKEMGAKKVMALPVGGAFHTPYMGQARDELRKAIAEATLREPDVPVVANIDARLHTDPEDWGGILSAQLCSPVRWRQSMQRLFDDGCRTFIELGTGAVLTGMAKRIVPDAKAFSVSTPDDLDKLLEVLAGENPHPKALDGEHLYMSERLVVSPAAGIFVPDARFTEGARVEVGDVIGHIGNDEVRSLFAGTVGAFVALDGERVTASQPIVWLRTA